MTTPITDFVKKYAHSNISRFHMPGHKGKSFLGCEAFDITEINGADVMGAASGIIAESEANASLLFNSRHSFYSTEGSSLSIKAMLALIKKKCPVGRKAQILAARNAHKSFVYACAVLDIDAKWIYPKDFTHLCTCVINPSELEEALDNSESLPDAVYITSPDYLGNISDVKGLAKICHEYGIPLLVDNAHGAYLAFLKSSLHPLALDADMCADSAHKTLPVLTGGAYLHISKNYNEFSVQEIRNVMSIFASTSPSYLTLQSLDLCNAYIADGYTQHLDLFVEKICLLKKKLCEMGFPPISSSFSEELKIVFSRDTCGYSGNELKSSLAGSGIEIEFADADYAVLMLTPENSDQDLIRLYNAFRSMERRAASISAKKAFPIIPAQCAMSIREAILSDSEILPVKNAEGRICASPTVSCPPAVPILVSGERIDKASIELLRYYGIEKIEVTKNKAP